MRLKLLIIILIVFYSHTIAEIKNDVYITAQKKFILELYKNKRYFDCIAETQRLLNYKDKSLNNENLKYFINTCYYSAEQYKTVISNLGTIDTGNIKNTKKPENLFLLSHSYHKIGYYNSSMNILNGINYSDIDESSRKNLFANKAEILINNYEYNDIFLEIAKAEKYVNRINHSMTLQDLKKDLQRYNEIGLRSKWLSASISAVIPGAGQVYSGKIMDGILSFTAVAGSAFGTYYFYNKKEKPLALTFAFFTCLFYGGNVYGAWNSALYTNSRLNRQFANELIKKYDLNYNPGDYINTGIFE